MKLEKFWNAAAFSFIMFGYGLVAIFVTDGKQSQVLTVPYRAAVLLISLYYIYNKLFKKNKDPIDQFLDSKKYFKSRESIRMFPLIMVFMIMYSFRFFNDVYGNTVFSGNYQSYFFYLYLISWIPSLSFLMIDLKRPQEYLLTAQFTLLGLAILMTTRLSALRESQLGAAQGRISSEALNPISLGVFSGSLIIIAVYILLEKKSSENWLLTRAIPFVSIALGLYFLIAAASRGPIISTAVCLLLLLVSSGKKLLYVGIPTVLAGSYVIVDFILPSLQGKGGSNLDRLTSAGGQSTDARGDLIGKSFELFSKNWHNTIFGYGVEIPKEGYPHNLIVESFLSTGVIGGCIFSLICLVAMIRAIDLVMSHDSWSWVAVLYVQSFLMGLSSGSLYGSAPFWYLLFAVNVLWNKKDYINTYNAIQQRYFS